MPDYSVSLNRDEQLVKASAYYSAGYDRWLHSTASLGDGGVILTTTPLGANSSFTQTPSIDRLLPSGANLPPFPIGRVRGLVWADQPGTLYLEESENNSTWTQTASVSVSASTTTELPWTNLGKRYFRFCYVNGATAQGSFVLIQQCAGLAVPNVQLTGSTVQDAQAIPMTQAQKDIVARAIDNIIDTIGAENIRLFLPMWETEGNKAYDLLNRDLTFSISGATLGASGPFGRCMSFDGVNDYLSQDPVTENAVASTDTALDGATKKLAQRMKAIATEVGFIRLRLRLAGTLSTATVRVVIYTDASGVPGSPITNGTSEAISCSVLATTLQWRGFRFATPPKLQKNQQYWVVLEYADGTGADASNYVAWAFDSAGSYGEPRAVFDGTTWTAQAGQSHTFGLWDTTLVPSADWSTVVAFKDTNTSTALRNLVATAPPTGIHCWLVGVSPDGYLRVRTSAGGAMIQANAYRIPAQASVSAATFSKAASTGKLKLYLNGRLLASADGAAGAGLDTPAQPYIIGASPEPNGAILYYWQGTIGPVIVASCELTAAQVAKVSHQLLALRKYGLGV